MMLGGHHLETGSNGNDIITVKKNNDGSVSPNIEVGDHREKLWTEKTSLETERIKDNPVIHKDGKLDPKEVFDYWDSVFESQKTTENNEVRIGDIEECLEEYFADLKDKSECPDTIIEKPFDVEDLKKLTPEENAKMREEFAEKKDQLKREWEIANGRPWPKYDHDVYSASGKLIRKAGSDYDAHHIQPLGMGGKNEESNITPLNAEVHYDKQGVHAPDSPYSKLDKMLGGSEQ